jgi:hypothetical protein
MKRYILISIVLLFLCVSCSKDNAEEDKMPLNVKITRSILSPFRQHVGPQISSEQQEWARTLYKDASSSSYPDYVKELESLLKKGIDPNYCLGDCDWIDSNPLDVIVQDFYNSYRQRKFGEKLPTPAPDITIINLLVKAGADINRRPYIWRRIHIYNNTDIDRIPHNRKIREESLDPKSIHEETVSFVNDANRLLKAFIDAGANPDMKGHPFPYSYIIGKDKMNDEIARSYFEKGTRPVNEAIAKGIVWESQVDLLLKYVKLDEDSLEAAKKSGDPKMIAKINRLWETQKKAGK